MVPPVTDDFQTLEEMMAPERVAKLDAVLAQRLQGITVLFEDVYKRQNVTACIRTVEAFGLQDIHIIEGETRFEPNKAVSLGCEKWLDIHRHKTAADAVARLRDRGYRVLATSLDADLTIDDVDFTEPACICFGNELKGISAELAGAADTTFRVPMFGHTQSFNLSVSVGLIVAAATKARREALGAPGDLPPERVSQLRELWVRRAKKGSARILRALSTRGPNP